MRELFHAFLKWAPAAIIGGAVAIASVWPAARDWIGTLAAFIWSAMGNPLVSLSVFAFVVLYVWAIIATRQSTNTTAQFAPVVPQNDAAPPHPAVFDTQLQELQALEVFLGRKDEMQLRHLFDLSEMLRLNFAMHRHGLSDTKEPIPEEINKYFKGGATRMSLPRLKVTNEEGQVASIEPIPGRIGFINLSPRHMQSMHQLEGFIDSPRLPVPIVEALEAMKQVIDRNTDLMIELLDNTIQESPDLIVGPDPDDQLYSRFSNRYNDRFRALKPLATDIKNAMRAHLRVD